MQDDERLRQPRQREQRGRGVAGGIVVALGLLLAKFKAVLAILLSFKWLVFGSKFLLSFGSMFLSVWVYALAFGGLKIAIVFVLMILVHELGHYLTWRNFGVPARLPFFIPLIGAAVTTPRGGTPAQNVAATIAGPLFGIGAAAACWGYGISTHQHFWVAAAYIGFFLNFFNLMPIPMLDGGSIAGAIDARLWFLGIPLFLAWIFFAHFSVFSILFLVIILIYALPQVVAVWQGRVNPRASGLTTSQRVATALAYFALALIAIGGAYATSHIPGLGTRAA
jgi:Zn-dependent protease